MGGGGGWGVCGGEARGPIWRGRIRRVEGGNKRGGAGWLSSLMHLSGPSRVIKFLYSPAPPPPTVWALKPPLWASCAENHLCTSDLYSPVHNVLEHAYPLLGEFSRFLGPKWHSPICSMPFRRAQKTLEFRGPTPSQKKN